VPGNKIAVLKFKDGFLDDSALMTRQEFLEMIDRHKGKNT